MATIITDLKRTYQNGNTHVRLIFINVGVFILTALLAVVLQLFNCPVDYLLQWLEMPASISQFLCQPWTLITYMFMHAGLLHILFNMLWLYWFGELFLQFFSSKHLRGLYILGGICGGLLYLLAYNIFPYFAPMISYSYLLGASASVLAIVAATAYRAPNVPIRLLLLGTLPLKYLALIVIGLDFLFLTSSNAGGHIAHVGGALAGLAFARTLDKGTDLSLLINRCIDGLTSLFKKKRYHTKMNIKSGGKRRNDYDYNSHKKAQNNEIDRILDKLKKSGYESLTSEEKKSLFDASKR